MTQQYPSMLLEKAVSEVSKLPGIGRKTALRLVLHLLRQDDSAVDELTVALTRLAMFVITSAIPTFVRYVRTAGATALQSGWWKTYRTLWQ